MEGWMERMEGWRLGHAVGGGLCPCHVWDSLYPTENLARCRGNPVFPLLCRFAPGLPSFCYSRPLLFLEDVVEDQERTSTC